mgnify:CR=1 FL=1
MKIDVDGYLSSQWEQHCRWEEEGETMNPNPTELAELAFEQYEFDSEVVITEENYDLIRQVFIDAFIKGCRHGNTL